MNTYFQLDFLLLIPMTQQEQLRVSQQGNNIGKAFKDYGNFASKSLSLEKKGGGLDEWLRFTLAKEQKLSVALSMGGQPCRSMHSMCVWKGNKYHAMTCLLSSYNLEIPFKNVLMHKTEHMVFTRNLIKLCYPFYSTGLYSFHGNEHFYLLFDILVISVFLTEVVSYVARLLVDITHNWEFIKCINTTRGRRRRQTLKTLFDIFPDCRLITAIAASDLSCNQQFAFETDFLHTWKLSKGNYWVKHIK